jgi:hypothetical protein
LIAAFVRARPTGVSRATHATLNSLQHVLKVAVFVAMGFAFRQYLPLIAAMRWRIAGVTVAVAC